LISNNSFGYKLIARGYDFVCIKTDIPELSPFPESMKNFINLKKPPELTKNK